MSVGIRDWKGGITLLGVPGIDVIVVPEPLPAVMFGVVVPPVVKDTVIEQRSTDSGVEL
jgi:hypothetical protein